MISKSFDDLLIYRKKYAAISQLSSAASKVYECFKQNPEIRLTTQIICKKTDLPRRIDLIIRTGLHLLFALEKADVNRPLKKGQLSNVLPLSFMTRSVLYGFLFGSLAQLVEQRTFNPLVDGSNPSRPTRLSA